MSNKHFDDLPEQPVAVKGVEKPKPAREFFSESGLKRTSVCVFGAFSMKLSSLVIN